MKLDPPTTIDNLPIPMDVQPTRLWTGQMLELAAHIGPYAALLLVDRLGGQTIRVPIDPERNRMTFIIGEAKARIMSQVYGGSRWTVPTGKAALDEARRGPIIAAIRAGTLTINEAVPILRTSRTRISHLVNHSCEGLDEEAWRPLANAKRDPRQIDMFDFDE